MKQINELLTEEQILGHLIEECAELIQAAHKIIREKQGADKPCGSGDYIAQLEEETADVIVCVQNLPGVKMDNIEYMVNQKELRWENCLNEEGKQ